MRLALIVSLLVCIPAQAQLQVHPDEQNAVAALQKVTSAIFTDPSTNKVNRIVFWKKGVNDDSLYYVAGLTEIKQLYMGKAQITDSGLGFLTGLTHLELLNLTGQPITDRGLVHLHGLKNLRTLFLAKTNVSDTGVRELRRAIPGLVIHR